MIIDEMEVKVRKLRIYLLTPWNKNHIL
jgi:hypothetical protein